MENIKEIYETYSRVFSLTSANKILTKFQVAIVDDDSLFSKMLSDFLNDKGIETKEFQSGEAYLSQMPFEGNQVVILDYYFDTDNAIDGLDVLKQIKKRNPEVPVIFLSANDDLESAMETLRNGAIDYFIKHNKTVFAQVLTAILKIDQLNQGKMN